MKKKSLFKRLSSVALALLLSLSAFTQGITASAFSDKNQATQQWLSTWSYDFRGSGLPKGYDIETGKYNDTHFTGYFATEVPYFTTSDNGYAYCINFDKLHNSGTVSKQQTLNDYMKNGHIPDNMQYQIKEFCIYSYKGKTQYGYSKDTELCASSVMSQAVSARFFDESITGLSDNETKLLNSYHYNGNNASAHHQELVECYKKMKTEMLSHYDVPSGTSKNSKRIPASATYPATYNAKTGKWTATVKLDSTLSQFSVSKPNAVTSQKSGSEIILTADNEKDLKNVVISITKTKGKYVDHIDECSPLILSGGSDVQEMVVSCYEDKDPVKAYLKITTPTGLAHINKTFTDYFGNAQTATADMYKAVKFQLAYKDGNSYKFVKASGKDGNYSFTDLASQATELTPNSKDGTIDITGLPEGSYEWREISTANGYMISSKKGITVSADKTASTDFVNKASVPNKGKLIIYKHDDTSDKYLSGAKFEITAAEDIVIGGGYVLHKAGTLIDTVTTDENGMAETAKDIYDGYSYTVTEIEAPTGYSLSAAPQTVKLASQQAEFVLDFYNTEWIVPFEITKTDVSTGELIPDCTFEILDENKNKVVTGVTDENGIAHFNLKYGKYFYREISAPEIYEIDNTPYPFEITEEGVTVKAKMTNKKKTGSIKVTKITTGNLNIEGIKFYATGISDTNKDLKFEATTNENGVAMFDKLVIGKYVITEDGSTVPYGYLVADSKQVTVTYAQTVDTDMFNEKVPDTKQAVVAVAQNGEHNIRHWVSVRYSPDELQHISSLVADYYAQSVIEHLKQNVQAVEVQDNSADTISADVTQQDKKIEPSRIIGLAENQLRPAVPNSSTSSITDSSGVVKSEKTFAEQVDEALSGKIPFYTSLKVCDTPQILLDVGCEQMPMLYSQKHLKNAILPPDEKNHRHGLEIEQIKRLPELLSYPVMIIDSPNRKDSIIVVTAEVDKSDNPVIASIKPNGKGRYEVENVSFNFITSVYGRENFDRHLELELQADNILYINKQKSQELSSVLRLQFSQGLNNLDSKEPIRHAAFTDKQLALSVLNGSDISISELFKVVKHYDNDFYINHSEQKSQELSSVLGLQSSQGLNALDSKEPIRLIEFAEEQLARSVLNGSDISTSELFKVVKHYDNDFYINHSEQKSQELSSVLGLQSSQGLNALDSKEPIRHIEFTDEQLARSVLKGSNISISDLFKVVKHYDNDFYINHSEQKSQELFSVLGLQLSKGLNILDSSVIIHQSRNIVKGMQQENNAEQLSFFENSTLEDTEVEIPFAVCDEIDYGERHYTISKIDKEKNTVTLLDYNTGWYPISHDEDLSMVIAEFEAVREKEIAGFVNIT